MIRAIKRRSIDYYAERIQNCIPVTLARYGDGEVQAIMGGEFIGQQNADGCTFTELLSNELRKTITEPQDYDYGILRIALNPLRKQFNQWQEENGIDVHWCDGDAILNDFLIGKGYPFIQALRKKRILIIGQYHLIKLREIGFVDFERFYIPDMRDSIERKNTHLEEIKNRISDNGIDMVLWSCGMHSKSFIYDLYKWSYGELTQIDCGSMWDGFCGVMSRSYMRRGRVDFQALIEVNSGQREANTGETFRIEVDEPNQ